MALDQRAAKQTFSASHAEKVEEWIGKRRWGWGMVGRKTGLSETDCRLQRANIKLSKYHYQMPNKVAAVRYWMQTVCFCYTWCNTLFSAISSGCEAKEEASLIGWIPKQITRLSDIGGWATWGVAAGLGAWFRPSCLTDYIMITTPCVLLWYLYSMALWGIHSSLDYWKSQLPYSFNKLPPPLPPPPPPTLKSPTFFTGRC